MSMRGYDDAAVAAFARTVLDDGFCIVPQLFPPETVRAWQAAFAPLLADHIAREGLLENRGSCRYYVTLPFEAPFADPSLYEHPDLLAILAHLVGEDMVMCQLATDTPLLGSDYQATHRDTPPLFPEREEETPPYQLAVNFPLVDVTLENGPIEIARGTHMLTREEGMRRLESGAAALEPFPMKVGDVMIRDVRGLHRGTPNRTDEARPMVVIGYSRRWLFRPEVSIRIPRASHDQLSERGKRLLRFNAVVEKIDAEGAEVYQAFAY